LMNAGSGKSWVMTGPLEKALFVKGAWEENERKEHRSKRVWINNISDMFSFSWDEGFAVMLAIMACGRHLFYTSPLLSGDIGA